MFDEKRGNEFHILVNNQKLEEHSFRDGNVYVWMPLFHKKVGYGVDFVEEIKGYGKVETISQKWPVCPYTVMVTNHTDKANFASLYVDGQKVAEKFVAPKKHIIFEGIPTESGIQELLFSLPRYATLREKQGGGRALPDALTNDLGTVKIKWNECVKQGENFVHNYKAYSTTSFTQANKVDAVVSGKAHAASSGGNIFASTTRAGKVLGLNEARPCTVKSYSYVGKPWSARILYRTKEYLKDMRVIPQDEVNEEEKARRRAKRELRRKRNREMAEAYRGGAPCPPLVPVDDAEPTATSSNSEEVAGSKDTRLS